VSALGTPAEVKPPAARGRHALHATAAAGFGIEINSALIFLHFNLFSFLTGRLLSLNSLAHGF
jgi:hypothetical protein